MKRATICAIIDWVIDQLADEVDEPVDLVGRHPDRRLLHPRLARWSVAAAAIVPLAALGHGGGAGGAGNRGWQRGSRIDAHDAGGADELEDGFDARPGACGAQRTGEAEVRRLRVQGGQGRQAGGIRDQIDDLAELFERIEEAHRIEAPAQQVLGRGEGDHVGLGRRRRAGSRREGRDPAVPHPRAQGPDHGLQLGAVDRRAPAGPIDERAERVAGLQQGGDDAGRHGQLSLAQAREHIFQRVSEARDRLEAEGRARALERVGAAEDRVEGALGLGVPLETEQLRLVLAEDVGRLLEEHLDRGVEAHVRTRGPRTCAITRRS